MIVNTEDLEPPGKRELGFLAAHVVDRISRRGVPYRDVGTATTTDPISS
jgi:hypothetical protein